MKTVLLIVLGCLALLALGWIFGPREQLAWPSQFDPYRLGEDLDGYLTEVEAQVPNLKPGAEKQIVWNDPETQAQTDVALVYVHGFSASLEEIRPVPDLVAKALGANLFYTRLTGHGRDGPAMAEATASAWMEDISEAMAIGRRLGKAVVLIGTSTGGTLASLTPFDRVLNENLAGIVLVAPNFKVQASGSEMLNMPWGRTLVPAIIGPERDFPPRNEGHAAWWTTSYPSAALVPMAATIEAARAQPHALTRVPVLAIFSEADQVVSAAKTREILGNWGGSVTYHPVTMGPEDDPYAHVIAGDIMSPSQTDPVAQVIADWISGVTGVN